MATSEDRNVTDETKPHPRAETRTVPDPSTLTTEQLLREIDRAVKLLQAEMKGASEVAEARFEAIEREFALIEDRRKEQKLDTKTAVDAALSAADKAFRDQTSSAEKSILKSETAAAEQSKQQYATFSASLKAVADTLADVKERVSRIEAGRLGASEHKSEARLDIGTIVSLVALAVVIISFFLTRS